MLKEKYLPWETKEATDNICWNQIGFFGCKVLDISVMEFEKAGKKLSMELEVPKLKKKFFLFAWDDNKMASYIYKNVKVGDSISCFTELSYYKNKEGRYCESYKIVPNISYRKGIPENPYYFALMRIQREIEEKKEKEVKNSFFTNEELINALLGN